MFLLPSATESFGLVALEAMACGVPVVGSRVGGLPEVVRHGRNGLLYPVGDVDAMAGGVCRLLRDRPRRKQYGKNGFARATTFFQKDRIVQEYLDYYFRVLDGA